MPQNSEKQKSRTQNKSLSFGQKPEKPKRKLPKKSQRAKRRYILFSFKEGFCPNSKNAFDLVMDVFPQEQRKELGTWFIEFKAESSKGIIRCHLKNLALVKKALEKIPKESGFKTLKTSGTLKSLRG